MNFAVIYVLHRLFFRIADFFHHWYVDGSRVVMHRFMSILEQLDRTFAVRVTFRYFFQPLYKDYTVVGRILGVIFRSGRMLIGGTVYLFLAAAFLVVLAAWFLLPPFLLVYAFWAV